MLAVNLPADSRIIKKLYPEAVWDIQNMLLAQIVDNSNLSLWAKTRDGEKNRNRPKPITRPGTENPQTGLTVSEIQKILARPRY